MICRDCGAWYFDESPANMCNGCYGEPNRYIDPGLDNEWTQGDDQEIPCPWCGAKICLSDPHTDGVLTEGYRDKCDECEQPFVVTAVDYDVTVEIKRTK